MTPTLLILISVMAAALLIVFTDRIIQAEVSDGFFVFVLLVFLALIFIGGL